MFSEKSVSYEKIQRGNILNRLNKVQEVGKLGYWEYDVASGDIWWSDNVYKLLNRNPDEGVPSYQEMLLDYDESSRKVLESTIRNSLKAGENYELELLTSKRTGIPKHIKATGIVEQDESGTKLFGIIQDISKLKIANHNLAETLQEKQLQFKELHHRIKNNLNTINSILFLKSKLADHDETKEAIAEIRNQILAIARTHEQLMRLEKYKYLSTRTFIVGWVESIMEMVESEVTGYEVNMQVEDHEISTDKMLALALIVQEVISNIFKYAYDTNVGGTVYVRLVKTGDSLLLMIGDEGKGMDSQENQDSIGILLIKALVEQIDGELTIHTNKGVKYAIEFPCTDITIKNPYARKEITDVSTTSPLKMTV